MPHPSFSPKEISCECRGVGEEFSRVQANPINCVFLLRPMLRTLTALALGGLLVAVPAAESGDEIRTVTDPVEPALTIHRKVNEVHVSFTVEDRHNRPVRNIASDEIRLFDDGDPVDGLTSFGENSDLPLRLALLVDCSDSMRKNFRQERRAAEDFAQRLLRPNVDSLLLVDFAGQSSLSDVSGTPHLVSAKIEGLEAAGHTALYDAIYEASTALGKGNETQPVRRVMILLSDGEDNDSRHGRAEALELVQRSDIVIYAITAHSRRYEYQGDAILRHITEATGGRAFVLGSFDQAEKAFTQIEAELRTQYSLTFRPMPLNRCGFHNLQVRYRDRKMRVRARDGYYFCER
jgi:VWFA-related protein